MSCIQEWSENYGFLITTLGLVPSEASSLISQDSFLERNLLAREVENLRIIHESEENSDDEKHVDGDRVIRARRK